MPNEFAAIIHQRAAGIARINRRIGLNEVLVVLDAEVAAALRAHDAHRHGLADAERIADRQRVVADLHFGRIAQRNRWLNLSPVQLQHRDVRLRIGADDLRLELALVRQRDLHVGRAVHDVVVRQHVAFRADDHA